MRGKWISLAMLALLVVFGLTGCGGGGSSSPAPAPSGSIEGKAK